jgi:hypothetical protein
VPVNPSPRGRTQLRALAVLFALALVAALAAVPASARSVTRHGAATLLAPAGPLASAADDGSGDTTDPSSGDTTSGDTTDTSGDPTTDDSSGDTSSDDGSGDDSSADDGTTIDDGSSVCDDTTDTSSADTTTDSSGDGTSTDGSDGTDGTDGTDTIAVCDDGSGDGSSTTASGSPRVTALHAAVVKRGGVRVTFRLDRAGRVALTLQAQSAGVSSGKRCVVPRAHRAARKSSKARSTAKKGRACTRTTALGGNVPVTGRAGANATTLTRWRGHKLAAGTYALTATPRAKGARAATTTFHVAAR